MIVAYRPSRVAGVKLVSHLVLKVKQKVKQSTCMVYKPL